MRNARRFLPMWPLWLEHDGHHHAALLSGVVSGTCAIGLAALVSVSAFAFSGCAGSDSLGAYELYEVAAEALRGGEGYAMDMEIVRQDMSGEPVDLEGAELLHHYEVDKPNTDGVEMKISQRGKNDDEYLKMVTYYRNGQVFIEDSMGKAKFDVTQEVASQLANQIYYIAVYPKEAVLNEKSSREIDGSHVVSFSVRESAIQDGEISVLGDAAGSEGDTDVTAVISRNGELKEVTLVFVNQSSLVTFKIYNIVSGGIQIDFPNDLDEYIYYPDGTGV
jgi:hypothetical protein